VNRILGFAYEQLCRAIFTFYCPVHVAGRENLPSPPYLMCSNHCSHLDTPVLMLAAGLPFSSFGMVAARDYFFETSSKRIFSRVMNLLPVDRSPSRQAIEEHLQLCRAFCKQNKVIILYPEGTRSRSGELQLFKKGAAQYALELKVPLVPVRIWGTYEAFPKGSTVPRPHKIDVRIGKPLAVTESGLPALRRATEQLRSQIASLEKG
jgi:1-acyl-sn-glycerol-3-phosphate acyltransferase/long-chain acyl-CoA synthetase